jgi:hypothetical protein
MLAPRETIANTRGTAIIRECFFIGNPPKSEVVRPALREVKQNWA